MTINDIALRLETVISRSDPLSARELQELAEEALERIQELEIALEYVCYRAPRLEDAITQSRKALQGDP